MFLLFKSQNLKSFFSHSQNNSNLTRSNRKWKIAGASFILTKIIYIIWQFCWNFYSKDYLHVWIECGTEIFNLGDMIWYYITFDNGIEQKFSCVALHSGFLFFVVKSFSYLIFSASDLNFCPWPSQFLLLKFEKFFMFWKPWCFHFNIDLNFKSKYSLQSIKV